MVSWCSHAQPFAAPIGIEALAHFEPPVTVGPDDTAYLVQLIPPQMRATFKTPRAFRRFSPDPFASENAAVAVAGSALARAELDPGDIDCIIATSFVAHWQQWYPAFGTFLHKGLGVGANVPVLNIQSQCASFADGLRLAWLLRKSNSYRRILVVAATEGLNEGDPSDPVAAWAGDGAAAAIVSSENLIAEFIGHDFFAVGELHRDYRMRLRGRAFPEAVPSHAIGDEYGFWAVRDLGALLKWMGEDFAVMLRDGMVRALDSAGVEPGRLSSAFFHQMGPRDQVVLLKAGEMLGIDQAVFRDTFDEFGCAGNVDGAITMSSLFQTGSLSPGEISMLHASGVGGSNLAIILRWLAK